MNINIKNGLYEDFSTRGLFYQTNIEEDIKIELDQIKLLWILEKKHEILKRFKANENTN